MILLYHKVYPEAKTCWWVDVERFHRDLIALRSRKVVYLDDYDPGDPTHAVITFDGIYRNVLEFAAPLLRDFGYPFELFFSGDHVGRSNAFDIVEPPADFVDGAGLARLIALGGRLQWHSASHADLRKVPDDALAGELTVPAEYAALDPAGFGWLAYPHGEFDERVLAATGERFRGAVSCNQGNDQDRLKLNRLTITNDSPALGRPTVAVIVASYNYGRFLIEAVDSVLAQSQAPDEIHLVDDHSDDDTPAIAAALASAHPGRLQLHRNERNLGIEANFNAAVARTRSDYVCIVGADNRLAANYVEALAGTLDRHPDVGVAYSDFALFGNRARLVHSHYPPPMQGRVIADQYFVVNFPEFTPESAASLRERNFIHGSSMYRRVAFEQVGGYASRSAGAEDHQLFRAMVERGWVAMRNADTMLEYRQHSREQANERLNQGIALRFFQDRTNQLQSEADAREREIAPLRARLDETARGLAQLQAEFASLQQNSQRERDEAQAAIDALRASRSWRITAPIRMVGHLAAGRFALVGRVIRNKLRD